MNVTNIKWETDGQTVDLPKEVNIPRGMFNTKEEIVNYLSDRHGFLIKSCSINTEPQTITVKELKELLNKLDDDTKVFMSSDTEGNSYSTINSDHCIQYTESERAIILWPYEEGLEHEDIDSCAKVRAEFYEKLKASYVKEGMSPDERSRAISKALDEAYESDAPFNN